MKKRILSIVFLMVFILAIPAQAASSRAVTVNPVLNIEGTTANCAVLIFGDNADDEIYAVIKLWKGSSCIKTWIEEETFYLNFKDTVRVSKGNYTLTVDATINGQKEPQVSISDTCN